MNQLPVIITARDGFTLIELMISIALGSMVVYTAIAGFRVASTSITLVNRLALENAIMRSGVEQAHDRVDFWTDADNPEDINQQGLRIKSTTAAFNAPFPNRTNSELPNSGAFYRSGLPFSDMIDVFPLSGVTPNSTEQQRESIKGWNPKDRWLMNESRTWFHGDLSDSVNGNKAGGYYSIFTNVYPSFIIGSGQALARDYGAVTPRHNWLMGQTMAMHKALGFYAFADYMPANHIYGAYGKINVGTGNNNWDQELSQPLLTDANGSLLYLVKYSSRFTQGSEWANEYAGNQQGALSPSVPSDLGRLTQASAFAMVSPDYVISARNEPQMPRAMGAKINNGKDPLLHQFKYVVGHVPELGDVAAMDYNQGNYTTLNNWAQRFNIAGAMQFLRFLDVTEMTTEVIPGGGPAQWPKAKVTLKRYVRQSRFVNLCSIHWTSPLTGTSSELNFTSFGTTLRGARQQRASQPMSAGVAAGWAKWYGPNDGNNSTTLDGDL